MRLILIGQRHVNIKFFFEVIDREQSIHIPSILAAWNHLRCVDFVGVEGCSDDFIHDVRQGKKTDNAAVFIQHDGRMHTRFTEFFQHAERFHGTRNEERLADERG